MLLHKQHGALQEYKNQVAIRFQLYNGLFTALPFHKIEKTGNLLTVLLLQCEEGFQKKMNPKAIIEYFFEQQTSATTEKEKNDMLFRFIQYAERQVVLFDALEDAAFAKVKDLTGPGTLKHTLDETVESGNINALKKKLEDFLVQLVLTAHPTQFYPGSVLGIINDISTAIKQNNSLHINTYLQQLGKTAFLNQKKPSPYDEAINLIWFLENVFYAAAGKISTDMLSLFPDFDLKKNPIVKMGFWPGGDRDGNPYVQVDTTIRVANALRGAILKCYYLDIRKMRRRLTFKGVEPLLMDLEKQIYNHLFLEDAHTAINEKMMLDSLHKMKKLLLLNHAGLFVEMVDNLIQKVLLFGLHFASLDIRQDSSVHAQVLQTIAAKENIWRKNYAAMDDAERMNALMGVQKKLNPDHYVDIAEDTLRSMQAIKTIQQTNGEQGCHRYIISHCTSAVHVMEVYALLKLSGWNVADLRVDIVPLFETIDDLANAANVMEELYRNKDYEKHLKRRGNKQTIMLGFSDGTKDGGYLMANWNIYKAKEALSSISEAYGISVVFFDGRGGPPARGGGKTHQFYASMGKNIANKEIQITVQGQTISSSFGTVDSAKYNIEQLLSAGIGNAISEREDQILNASQNKLLQQMANTSYKHYIALKTDPQFLDYLCSVSPLLYYAETNIGSRPAKRGTGKLNLDALRAIPFVGAWSQLKQNITGYYGLGTALEAMDKLGKFAAVKKLYQSSLFFKTLIDNSEMSMRKCYFPLTAYLATEKKYSKLYKQIFSEFERSKKYVLKLSGAQELMEQFPVEELSIQMRDRIVLPLHTIQQYAIQKINDSNSKSDAATAVYKKLIIRSSFGIINAARNSV